MKGNNAKFKVKTIYSQEVRVAPIHKFCIDGIRVFVAVNRYSVKVTPRNRYALYHWSTEVASIGQGIAAELRFASTPRLSRRMASRRALTVFASGSRRHEK